MSVEPTAVTEADLPVSVKTYLEEEASLSKKLGHQKKDPLELEYFWTNAAKLYPLARAISDSDLNAVQCRDTRSRLKRLRPSEDLGQVSVPQAIKQHKDGVPVTRPQLLLYLFAHNLAREMLGLREQQPEAPVTGGLTSDLDPQASLMSQMPNQLSAALSDDRDVLVSALIAAQRKMNVVRERLAEAESRANKAAALAAPAAQLDSNEYLDGLYDKLAVCGRGIPAGSLAEASNSLRAFTRRPPPGPGETYVNGMRRPNWVTEWPGYDEESKALFGLLETVLKGKKCFPSLADIQAVLTEIPSHLYSEKDIHPFMRIGFENPAARLVSKFVHYLNESHIPEIAKVVRALNKGPVKTESEIDDIAKMHYHKLKSVTEIQLLNDDLEATQSKKHTTGNGSTSTVISDSFPCVFFNNNTHGPLIVGEFKAAYPLDFLKQVTPLEYWKNNSFARAVERCKEMYFANIFCHIYYSMIVRGNKYGYLASGDFIVFLCIPDDGTTLYYHWLIIRNAGSPLATKPKHYEEFAVAQLATLYMRALMDGQQVVTTEEAVRGTTPATKALDDPVPASSNPDRDAETEDTKQNKRKKTDSNVPTSSEQSAEPQTKVHKHEPPTLPYCTQACLRGLSNDGLLDDSCPNVELHRAASQHKDKHPIAAAAVPGLVVAQLDHSRHKDWMCLSLSGRNGTLYRLVITAYGYSLVAKVVMNGSRHILEHEHAVYKALLPIQGRLIPVCLGISDVTYRAKHLLLMSYAGPMLEFRKTQLKLQAADIDWEAETKRTKEELRGMDLHIDHWHLPNVAWNEESKRVMRFDFDEARIGSVRPRWA